jgi:phosphoribosylformimino-5-aminoimidazole carboxamide ribotide isomerase
MQILPAIDMRGGKCVRLRQGDYDQETVYAEDPVSVARTWLKAGAKTLHLVDLDGAKEGKPVHGDHVRRIVSATGLPIQFGGGVRTEEDIQEALGWGVKRIVLGTKALQDPAWVRQMAKSYPQTIVLGLDARDGKVATHGWLEISESSALDLAREFANWPLAGIVFTDISKDGMMAGPNVAALREMSEEVALPIIASGGVTTLEDIRKLLSCRLAGCIIGKALYEGRLDLKDVLSLVAGSASHTEP